MDITNRGMATLIAIMVIELVLEPIIRKGLRDYLEDVLCLACVAGIIYFAKWWLVG